MIKSMTGFGLASTDHESVKFSVEIKSLNSKFLELGLKIPKAFSDKELYLRNLCNKEIERGKVSIAITVERSEETQKGASINEILLKKYYNQLIEVNKSLGANIDNLLPTVLNLPEVITYTEEEASESEWKVLESTFAKALKNFNQFRIDEGAILKADLELRIKNIMAFF